MSRHCPKCLSNTDADIHIVSGSDTNSENLYYIYCYNCDLYGPMTNTIADAWSAFTEMISLAYKIDVSLNDDHAMNTIRMTLSEKYRPGFVFGNSHFCNNWERPRERHITIHQMPNPLPVKEITWRNIFKLENLPWNRKIKRRHR